MIVGSCDGDGVRVSLAPSWSIERKRYVVATARISNLSDGCEGAEVLLSLRDDAGSRSETAGVVRGGTAKLELPSPLAVARAREIELIVSLAASADGAPSGSATAHRRAGEASAERTTSG
jgi:hypothetical protein